MRVRPAETACASYKCDARRFRIGGWRKRAFDVVCAALALIILSPLLLAIALLISLQDRGPIVFGHRRIGYRGRAFKCWKFRSMAPGAEERLAEVLADPAAAAEWRARCKLARDPRVTPIGFWLRRLSLDELPQLFNVLVGNMSLVGPRPVTEQELARFGAAKHAYLSLRPGISGLWQVSGRSELSYEHRVRLEARYADAAWRLSADLVILLRTIPLLFTGRGAY